MKRVQLVRRARKDPSAFIEYVLRNERDGSVIQNAPFHREWQEFITANDYAALMAPVEHAKSQQISVGRLLFELGTNPGLRCALISNTAEQAKKLLRQIRTEIEENPRLHEVFPKLRRSSRKADPWHATAITVQRDVVSKDPSVAAYGAGGPIVGSRLDLIILDDVLDFENTLTSGQRKKLIEWFDTTVLTRATEECKVWAIGTPWALEDLLHDLMKRPGFASRTYAAVANPDDNPLKWKPIWPEQWPVSRLLKRKANTLPGVFARKYLCRVRRDDTSRFKQLWIDRMLAAGKGRYFVSAPPRSNVRGPLIPCFTGVDLGVGKGKTAAKTVLFTIGLLRGDKRVILEIESGRWRSPEIVDRLESVWKRFGSVILVENNGAQQFLLDGCAHRFPVHGFRTDKKKWSPEHGVETLAVEIRNGQWIAPSGRDGVTIDPELQAWLSDCLYYDPEAHTGDHLMAAWFAREAARLYSAGRLGNLDTQAR